MMKINSQVKEKKKQNHQKNYSDRTLKDLDLQITPMTKRKKYTKK